MIQAILSLFQNNELTDQLREEISNLGQDEVGHFVESLEDSIDRQMAVAEAGYLDKCFYDTTENCKESARATIPSGQLIIKAERDSLWRSEAGGIWSFNHSGVLIDRAGRETRLTSKQSKILLQEVRKRFKELETANSPAK